MSDNKDKVPAAGNAQGADSGSDAYTPQIDFTTLVLSITESALVCLGVKADPETGTSVVRMPEAVHSIEMLALLERKTIGNLTPDEEQLLKGALYELRMHLSRHTG